jgi:hypothetical protein
MDPHFYVWAAVFAAALFAMVYSIRRYLELKNAGDFEEVPEAGPRELTAAENFVHGIYAGISDLDERMKGIEAALSNNHINSDFTVKFLEDIVQDMDSLDKGKIKARLEYLLSDLKK